MVYKLCVCSILSYPHLNFNILNTNSRFIIATRSLANTMEKVRNIVSQVVPGQTKLPTATLGKDGPQVTRLGYGAMGLVSLTEQCIHRTPTYSRPQSIAYGTAKSDEERFKVFDKLYEDGQFFWDTADLYGDNEDLLGESRLSD